MEPQSNNPTWWSVQRRIVISALVAFHVTAVFVGAFASPPTSVLGDRARVALRPYIEAADLDHGYRFFNIPGPSHLIRYELEFADGRPKLSGKLPHRTEHWPRLRYHRHFMLTETLNSMYQVSPEPPRGVRPGDEAYEQWQRAREELNRMADVYLKSYGRHLLASHGASKVTLWGIERGLPSMDDVQKGTRLNDQRFVGEVKLGELRAGE